jgi:hypothetical protein
MDPRTVIASRIDLQLRRHLRQGVDAMRALSDARYAADMLLVCDAMIGTDLPLLARQFRQAGELMAREARQKAPGRDAGPPQPWAANTSGFGLTKPPRLDTQGGRDGNKRWFSPSTWLGD